ncbi:agmatinase [Metallumcola ferriviriculae]|uniref:Agmatinase n=1 Tax=Metallumcola ferriviriculae TaxID=3039180 RepID=A0AAU0UNE4_9FIRM|nr:agmatinase [Desulfitibacteraceae bacterium MK1]
MTLFMGSIDKALGAKVVLIGAPMDFTVSFRPGTRLGPQQMRNVSDGLEEYSHDLGRELVETKFFDSGDLELPFGNVSRSLDIIGGAIRDILKEGQMPFLLGGEHLVSFPAVEAVYNKYQDLVVLHFDAHADLRTDYLGESQSHATVIRKVSELIGGQNVYQFGIRSGTKEEFAYARDNTNLYYKTVKDALAEVLPTIKGRPVYLTIDIDVLDPAFAPGTGTPEPGGICSRELFESIYLLKGQRVVGMDLVEVSPFGDETWRTALAGAKIIRELLLLFA